MKLILTKKYFDLGGKSCAWCPVRHALRGLGFYDILVTWECSSFDFEHQSYHFQHSGELFEIIRQWDVYNIVPQLPKEFEIDFEKEIIQ